MASSFVGLSKPLSSHRLNSPTHSNKAPTGLTRRFLKINAIKRYEPTEIVPQADRVLIRLVARPEKSVGGVLLPTSAVKFERYLVGEVLSVGGDVKDLETGKKVLVNDINAYEIDLGTDERHCFCKAGDVLAVVE